MPQLQTSTQCGMARAEDGTRICSLHQQPLTKQATYGEQGSSNLPSLSAWQCPVSRKMIIDRD